MGSYFGTDKITVHGYFPEYMKIAAQLGPEARVCELGVESGESLRMWQSLFPLGEIWGVDISRTVRYPEGTHGIICAQDDPQLPGLLGGEFPGSHVPVRRFDLIVDDASHHGIATRKSFELLFPLVKPGGFYVIEDWMVALRDAERPGETWGKSWGDSMLRAAEGFLPLLAYPDGVCESVTYRYGMIIICKRSAC